MITLAPTGKSPERPSITHSPAGSAVARHTNVQPDPTRGKSSSRRGASRVDRAPHQTSDVWRSVLRGRSPGRVRAGSPSGTYRLRYASTSRARLATSGDPSPLAKSQPGEAG